jgi:hypothetical protein
MVNLCDLPYSSERVVKQFLLIYIENHLHMNAKFNALAELKNLKVLNIEQAAKIKGGDGGDEDKRRGGI